MDNEEIDLPRHVADALRAVAPVDPAVKEAHLSAAMAAWTEAADRPARVTSLDTRRRVLLSTAAAALLVVGAGVGWVVHSPRATPVAADVSVGTSPAAVDTESTTDSTVAKGSTADMYAPQPNTATARAAAVCDFWGRKDLMYVGSYSTADHTYVLMLHGSDVQWFDKDTCDSVMTVPGPTTSTP